MKKSTLKNSICMLFILIFALSSGLSMISVEASSNYYTSVEELEGKKVGVLAGSVLDKIAEQNIKNCKIKYFNSNSDVAIALDAGLIDAYLNEEPIVVCYQNQYKDQAIIGKLTSDDYAFFLQKNNEKSGKICKQLNEFLRECKNNGYLDYLKTKWTGSYEDVKTIDFTSVESGENGTLEFATSTDAGMPFSYIKDGKFAGYDIELAVEFCKAYGYGLNITNYAFSALLNSVESGFADFAAACVTVTEERKEKVLFSEANYSSGIVVVCKKETTKEKSPLDAFNGGRIGVVGGSIFDTLATENIEDCSLKYYNSFAEAKEALNDGEIDAYITDLYMAEYYVSVNKNQKIAAQLNTDEYGFIFRKDDEKGSALCKEYNEFIKDYQRSGLMEQLENKWLRGSDEEGRVYDTDSVGTDDTKPTLIFGTCTDLAAPFSYYKDDKIVGFDIELACEFCKAKGYNIQIRDFTFEALLEGVATGAADFGGGCISITEERRETLLFSDCVLSGGAVLVSLVDGEASKKSFFESIMTSFNKTFIKEDRWKLFLEGVVTTMLITVASLVLGFILGFVLFLICRRGNKIANVITNICFGIVQRLPIVVLLMILYYVVLGKVIQNGIIVSIICFSLTFAAAVFGIIKNGVKAIGKEQYEAAYALGFSNLKTYFKVILPQAAQQFMPLIRSEVVTHIKATAIVGYIAVSDLTRMSDIVRSRTFEAFFPLIVTAVIYFVLEEILVLIVRNIEIGTDNRKRRPDKILKGIKTK